MRIPIQLWRWAGGITLGAAVVMLVLGLSIFEERLNGAAFAVWWATCLVLTMFAMFFALLDLRRIRVQSRDQHRELIQTTLTSIERENLRKKANGGNAAGPG